VPSEQLEQKDAEAELKKPAEQGVGTAATARQNEPDGHAMGMLELTGQYVLENRQIRKSF
jgi:hypothetical protein